jgi:hypothetical protein
MSELPTLSEAALDAPSVKQLGRQLADAFLGYVDYQKRRMGLSAEQAVAKAEGPWPDGQEEAVLRGPPEQVHWFHLEALARTGPERAVELWQALEREALDELRSGHRAAKAAEGYGAEAWQRAQFLALRRDLAEAFSPRDGVERQLIDVMAQAQSWVQFWQLRLAFRASVEAMREEREADGGWTTPRVSEHQAIEQAAAMVERFHRMYLRTLKALREQRRGAPSVLVQSAGQVNVGGQQVNVNGGAG